MTQRARLTGASFGKGGTLPLGIVRELKGSSRYLLPSPAKDDGPIRSTSLSIAMQRFGERLSGKTAIEKGCRPRTTCAARLQPTCQSWAFRGKIAT